MDQHEDEEYKAWLQSLQFTANSFGEPMPDPNQWRNEYISGKRPSEAFFDRYPHYSTYQGD